MAEDKMIPEAQLITYKKSAENREEKLKKTITEMTQERDGLKTSNSTLSANVKTLKANLEDEGEVKEVREYLLEEDKRITELRSQTEKDRASVAGERKEVRARELVAEYGPKGLALEKETLLNEEDMDKYALSSFNEFLVKQKGETKPPENPAESVFDTGDGSVVKKSVKDMSDDEFNKHWNQNFQTSLSKK